MKKFFTLICATAMSVMAFAQPQPVVVIDEDFSGFTEGSETEPLEESFPVAQPIGAPYLHSEGWNANGVHQAGGCCALMPWDYYGYPYDGTIQTPEMALYGTVTITLKAKKLNGQPGTIWLSLCDNDYYGPVDETDLYLSDEWQEFTFTSDKAMFNDRAIFQITAYDGVALIDDIKVVRVEDRIPTPMVNYVENLSTTSFKASWQPSQDAESYLFSTYYLDYPSDRPYVEGAWFEDFSGDTDWTMVDTKAKQYSKCPDRYTVMLGQTTQSVTSPETPEEICGLSFWVMPSKSDEYYYDSSLLGVSVLANGKWEGLANLPANWMDPKGGYREYNAEQIGRGATQVRFDIPQADKISFFVTDIKIEYATGRVEYFVFEDEEVEGTSKVVEDINPEGDYYFYVKAKGKGLQSAPSEHKVVDGVSGLKVEALPAINLSESSFTANWVALPHADKYIVDIDHITSVEADTEHVVVLSEDFSGITTGTLDNPESYFMNVDLQEKGQTATQWVLTQPQWCEGMAGTKGTSWYGSAGLVCSPVLSLDNNRGAFYVNATVYTSVPGETIFVIIIDNLMASQALAAQAIEYGAGESGFLSKTVYFSEGGQKDIYVAFMSMSGQGFFVDDVVIYQDLKAGETLNRPYGRYTVEENELHLSNLPANDSYAYCVMATRTKDFETYNSEFSDPMVVSLETTGVEDIAIPSDKVIRGGMGCIRIVTPSASNAMIYDLQGRMRASTAIRSGETTLRMAPGVYVVVVGDKAQRVLVK